MNFEPQIHTKQYLLDNKRILKAFAENSVDFARSQLAGDFDILTAAVDVEGFNSELDWTTIGHVLAKKNAAWLENPSSQLERVLNIKDSNGWAIAHELATSQLGWASYPMSKNLDVLSITSDSSEEIVASVLAENNPTWIANLTVDDMDIFRLKWSSVPDQPVAKTILEHNASFLNDAVLQHPDFLSIPHETGGFSAQWKPERYVSTTAHLVAEKIPAWANTASARDFNILSMRDSRNYAVAHALAYFQPQWTHTKAASLDAVLSLTDLTGLSVAQSLATHRGNQCPKRVWDPEYLYLKRDLRNWKGRTVAHDLAQASDQWVQSAKEAFQKETLLMCAEQLLGGGKPPVYVSVAEMMHSLKFEDIVIRVLQAGAALKLSCSTSTALTGATVDSELIHRIVQKAADLIDGYADPLAQLKLTIALYSTLFNFKKVVLTEPQTDLNPKFKIDQSALEACDAQTSKLITAIEQQLDANKELIHQLGLLPDIHCEPGQEVLDKYLSKQAFVSLDTEEASKSPIELEPGKLLY